VGSEPEPIETVEFDAAQLMRDFPPHWRHAHKQLVYDIACPVGFVPRGRVIYSRWNAVLPLPRIDSRAAVEKTHVREAVYDYQSLDALPDAVDWHVNFADPNLFVAYGSALFAQDEMQVAEHPVLGSVRQALLAQRCEPVTVDASGATPVLITGAERRCRIATDRNAAQGRPAGLYGNAFALGTPEAIRHATVRLDPPTVTNLIAMAALPGNDGHYSAAEIAFTLGTAFSGFRAAVLESARQFGPRPVVVHSGFWGCGAFGGNRVLMSMLQMLAAQAAGVGALVYHTGSPPGTAPWNRARDLLLDARSGIEAPTTAALCEGIAALGFAWGKGDGN